MGHDLKQAFCPASKLVALFFHHLASRERGFNHCSEMMIRSELETFFDRLWPICRSIMGEGFRQSLDIISEILPLERVSFPSGTNVHDWTVPLEWNIDDAWIKDPSHAKIVDFQKSNLHVLNYSAPIEGEFTLEELNKYLYSIPELPEAIPYLTSYYSERWGFCLSHKQRESLKPGKYSVKIASSLKTGSLDIGHAVLKSDANSGQTNEFLISTYLCHPSMANNELSGPLVTAFLYRELSKVKSRNYNYRFVVGPETIGAICYLSKFGTHLKEHCKGGLVVTCVGDGRNFHYKKSRRGNSSLDRIMQSTLKSSGTKHNVIEFFPHGGSDERQYCSPGYDLPVGVLMHSAPSQFKEYHTSLDNKSMIDFKAMQDTIDLLLKAILEFDRRKAFVTSVKFGEPMLGARGLYPTLGSQRKSEDAVKQLLWVLNYSDGQHDLGDIAEKSGFPLSELEEAATRLVDKGLIS